MKRVSWIGIGITIAVALLLCYFGLIWPTSGTASRYEVHGIDVSSHQGDIDWAKVAQSGHVQFVYMKATEGADFQDKQFVQNWKAAGKEGLIRGAYHYFKTTSKGEDQAANFIHLVPAEKGCLPPVIDIEEDSMDKEQFRAELKAFVAAIEKQYGCKPILYLTYPLFEEYIKGHFTDCPIWIRDIILTPMLQGRQWLFWQYCSKGRISGITGYVDLNVFHGKVSELETLVCRYSALSLHNVENNPKAAS